MADITFIGSAVAVVAAKPATTDAAGFAALSWVATLGEVLEFGELGDTSEDVSVKTLAGRVKHMNGALDGGEIAFSFQFENADAGQVIMRTTNNTQTDVSFRITDTDGRVSYIFGRVANVRDVKREASMSKGMTGVLRANSPVIRV